VAKLMEKIKEKGVQLKSLQGKSIPRNTTGLNGCLLIDDADERAMIKDDHDANLLFARRFVAKTLIDGSTNGRQLDDSPQIKWRCELAVSNAGDNAEKVFAKTYPSCTST